MFSFPKKRFLFIVLLLLAVFSLNAFKHEIRSFFYSVSSGPLSLLWNAGGRISQKGNEQLLQENLMLRQQVAELQGIQKENEEFRNAFQLEKNKEFQTTASEILGSNVSKDFILISKGETSGVKEGMAVITGAKVLVGRIVEVFDNTSTVVLAGNKDFSFDAQVAGKEIYGLAKGQGSGRLLFDLVPKEKDLVRGDLILTSRFGEIFPGNLLVGTVKEIEKKDVEHFQNAVVDPLFHVESSRILFIIL
ncbi:MAG: rod shape-determining protein MreC [Candidatus Wildermuthbacteria bacterium]|nr:rod shape-determining protein MreC [Candidatus Wildermuthbacteria bacterium]